MILASLLPDTDSEPETMISEVLCCSKDFVLWLTFVSPQRMRQDSQVQIYEPVERWSAQAPYGLKTER